MKRKMICKLLEWKEQKYRKPLILKGVRQCGKTYLLKQFGEKYYKNTAYFNFEESKHLKEIFEYDYDINRIVFELELILGKKIVEDETLIIFDEIQECSNAITSLKYFCENAPRLHIVCAGSLLGVALHSNYSFPVGKVDILTLYPMDFSEFLLANGEKQLYDYMQNQSLETRIPLSVGEKMKNYLKQYYIVGGMPEVVKSWINEKDISKIEEIQKLILDSYELDFAKHAPIKEFPKLTAIWRSIPEQLAKPNSKFIFSRVKKGSRSKDLEDALEWLISAGLIQKVCRIEKPFFPLSSYADDTTFKLYLSDIGLLRRLSGLPAESIISSNSLYSEFKGALTENYVLLELIKSIDDKVFYWTSGNLAEVDFVLQCKSYIIPIEVKSEKNRNSHSLTEYRKKYSPTYSVKTSMKETFGKGEVIHIPLFYISLLEDLIK